MTERRETGRSSGRGKPPRKPATRKPNKKRGAPAERDWSEGERIAKYLARAGVASRRECETLIENGKVSVNGERLTSPAFKVTGRETIKVYNKIVSAPEPARLWRYHKPAGLITSNNDPAGRRTVHDELPKTLPRVITIGRLDLNTEGLLLLTNDGGLARAMELPKNELPRAYRARAHGLVDEKKLAALKNGIEVDGVKFGSITAELERSTGMNNWLTVSLMEGKKREVRRALEAVGLQVNRLIRVSYGPFLLGDLKPGAVEEITPRDLVESLGHLIPEGSAPSVRPARGSRVGSGGKRGNFKGKSGGKKAPPRRR